MAVKMIKDEFSKLSEDEKNKIVETISNVVNQRLGVTGNSEGIYTFTNTDNYVVGYGFGIDTDKPNPKSFIPTKVIFCCPATICFFPDGSKEVVKCADDEEFIHEVGVMACIMKKLFKSRNEFKRLISSGYETTDSIIERQYHNLSAPLKRKK